jgi:hypothetical protein
VHVSVLSVMRDVDFETLVERVSLFNLCASRLGIFYVVCGLKLRSFILGLTRIEGDWRGLNPSHKLGGNLIHHIPI